MVAIPDGFLVPFKDDGYIYLVDISGSTPQGPYKLTDHTEGKWFYHRVVWKDMDGDGDLDILTCRAREPVFSIFCKLFSMNPLLCKSYTILLPFIKSSFGCFIFFIFTILMIFSFQMANIYGVRYFYIFCIFF